MSRVRIAVMILIGLITPMTNFANNSPPIKLTTKKVLNIAAVKEIAVAAEAKAEESGWNVSIAIVDDSGRLLYFQRMDNTPNSSVDIAIAKAQHAANYERDTKFHQDLLEKNKVVLALPSSMPLEGGLKLMANDMVIGGIGVSGVQASEDGEIAQAGADRLMEQAE